MENGKNNDLEKLIRLLLVTTGNDKINVSVIENGNRVVPVTVLHGF